MTRKCRLLLALMIAVTLVAAAGCAKKRTPAPAPLPEEKVGTDMVAPKAAPHEATSAAPGVEGDPLGGDLDDVNAYVHEKGLIGDVYFDFDQSQIKDESVRRLRQNAEFMRAHPQFVFAIEGHCDDRDTIEYNLALGQRRADATQTYLSDLEVGKDHLQTVSYGKERPVCEQMTEECRSQNRRAHFLIAERRAIDASR